MSPASAARTRPREMSPQRCGTGVRRGQGPRPRRSPSPV